MKRILLPLTLSMASLAPVALGQPSETPAKNADAATLASTMPYRISPPAVVATQSERAAIERATAELNKALLRGDAPGVLKWLAPDFEMSGRQYLVRDLAWMKSALPLQLKRGRYTMLKAQVKGVEIKEGVAFASERIDAEIALNPKVTGKEQLQQMGVEGAANALWIRTAQGWRLQRPDSAFEQILFLGAPPAPRRLSPADLPMSSAAAVGIPLQEPRRIWERRVGWFSRVLAFSPDSKQLAFNYDTGEMRFVSPQNGTLLHATPESTNTMIYTRDGRLWTKHGLGKLARWNAGATAVEREWTVAPQYTSHEVSIAPDGKEFAVVQGSELRLWNADQKEATVTTALSMGTPYHMEYSPDGNTLVLGPYEGVEVRNAHDGTLIREVKGQRWGRFLDDGQTMVTMKLRDNALRRYPKGEEDVLFFRSVATGEVVREVKYPAVWSGEQEQLRAGLDAGHSVTVYGFNTLPAPVVSPDGRTVASVYFDGQIGIWDTSTGQIVRMLRGFRDVNQPELVFSPDGRQLAVSSHAGEIAVWDVSLPGH